MENNAIWITGQYDRLYDQLKGEPERKIICWVNYTWRYQDGREEILRDICTIKGTRMEFSSRGCGYGGVDIFIGSPDESKYFLEECERLKVQWLDESGRLDESPLLKAITQISNYKHECGCVPCVGQCRDIEGLQIAIDGLIEIAANALAKQKKEVEK